MLFYKGLKLIRYLSLDIALGTVCMAVFIAKEFDTSLDIPILLVLFFSTWIVYTLDHLFDAIKYSKSHLHFNQWSGRHKFHFIFKKQIFIALVLVMIVQCVLLMFLPRLLILWGMVLVAAIIVYMIVTHIIRFRIMLLKEGVIAFIYSISILLPTVLSIENNLDTVLKKMIIYLLVLYLIAISNVLLITCYESKRDARFHESHNFGSLLGKKKGLKIVFYLLLIYMICILVNIPIFGLICIFWLSMGAILILVSRYNSYFEYKERYRNYADMIFFIPISFQYLGDLFFSN